MLAAQVMGAQSLTGKSSFRICVTTRTGSAFKQLQRRTHSVSVYVTSQCVVNPGAYHFAIPLYQSKINQKVGNTTKIPVNVRH